MQSNKQQSILLGLAASLLFSVTFIVNRLMSLEGGSWIWSSSLRFYWMVPFFVIIVWYRRGLTALFIEIKKNLLQWLIWSTVGFGLFYAPLTFAAEYTPSWLLASTWQFTIIAGMLIAPFIDKNKRQALKSYRLPAIFSAVIILGIVMMQVSHAQALSAESAWKGVVPVLIAAVAYPLGNRKMMHLINGRLSVYQRILGMTLCSLPFWFILNLYQIFTGNSYPTGDQYFQTLIVAIFSGVLATVLFFTATEKVRSDDKQLAAVEATQSTEVLFALAGEALILASPLPDMYGVAGIILVMVGMILHSLKS